MITPDLDLPEVLDEKDSSNLSLYISLEELYQPILQHDTTETPPPVCPSTALLISYGETHNPSNNTSKLSPLLRPATALTITRSETQVPQHDTDRASPLVVPTSTPSNLISEGEVLQFHTEKSSLPISLTMAQPNSSSKVGRQKRQRSKCNEACNTSK